MTIKEQAVSDAMLREARWYVAAYKPICRSVAVERDELLAKLDAAIAHPIEQQQAGDVVERDTRAFAEREIPRLRSLAVFLDDAASEESRKSVRGLLYSAVTALESQVRFMQSALEQQQAVSGDVAKIADYLDECARGAIIEGDAFDLGVRRGLEIAAAQVRHGHATATRTALQEDGRDDGAA